MKVNRPGSEKLVSCVWTWQQVLVRAVAVLRDEGVKSLWFKILGETVYRRAVLMECLLDEPPGETTLSVTVEVRPLTKADVDDYVRFRPDADPSDIRRRLETGQRCFVARYKGCIVHASWSATQRVWIDSLAREIRLAPDEVYVYETYTVPPFRGKNIPSLRSAQERQHFRAAGYRRMIAVVMPENTSGLRQTEQAGYHPIGVMGYVKLGPWRWDFCRVKPGTRTRGILLATCRPAYWDGVDLSFGKRPHYLDAFLGELKRQAHLELIQRWEGVPEAGRVLKTDLFEESAGPDAFLGDLCAGGGTVVGMDVSAAIVHKARSRDENGQIRYVAADTRRLPFADDSFALIVSPSTLDHFPDPRDLGCSLRELARVLAPDGRLIITLDNRQNIFDPLLRFVSRMGWTPYYLGRSYRVGELRAELEAAGFVVQETTAILHNPRLTAVAAVACAKRLDWPPLTHFVQKTLTAAQRLEHTRWRYFTGSFVAAKAVRKG